MDVTFLEDKPFFPVSPLQGENTSEETNVSTYSLPCVEDDVIENSETVETTPNNANITDGNGSSGETQEDEDLLRVTECDHRPSTSEETGKAREYDASLDMPIALRKWTSNLSFEFRAFIINLDTVTIPTNVHVAMEILEWKAVVMDEMKALETNKTWDLMALPKGHNTFGCKWVFTVKYKSDGTLDRYKARMVAKRLTQMYGIDYS
ncbi:uncharacterized protein LOC120084086 [Benincasa hispida]|uniref:uncharacterized protein LOC120084086 n=1 Tax=Benincasa hispida TaxID=102211 RepID=UPI0018FF4F97|nr:uncharacterized protein LOC120084086 [Benincasa hispida]